MGVAGAAGRMGREVCRAVASTSDMTLVAELDPAFAVEGATSVGPGEATVARSADLAVLTDAGAEVVVDFSTADAARRTIPWCAARGVHTVVGTTGLGPDDLAEIERALATGGANAVVAANFAIGAVLLMRFCEIAAPLMEGVEIVELHHDAKRDAPSGTALVTAERIVAARRAAGAGPLPADPTTEQVVAGARGGDVSGVRVHSVRLPGLVAHQEVVFGATGQSLSLRHDSFDRRSFMPGVLLAVRAVADRPGLTLGIEPILGV